MAYNLKFGLLYLSLVGVSFVTIAELFLIKTLKLHTIYTSANSFIVSSLWNQENIWSFDKSCDINCGKFRELMRGWPKDTPKAAIVILTRTSELKNLQIMLHKLDIFFLNRFPYPIIIFHEEDYRPHIDGVKSFSNASMFFQEMNFSVPEFINMSRVPRNICGKAVGYRHMCRFQAKLIYEEPIIEGLEFVFRLDDDSLLMNHVKYDLFKFMRDRDLWYGYRYRLLDKRYCVIGLWNATAKYIKEHNVKPTFFEELPEPKMIYNNFEISRVDFWKGKEYQDYMNYIDIQGGIYYKRWGDAPIKSLGLSLFMPKEKLHHFKDIPYKHT